MITVIDYGSGNLRSVAKALEKVGGNQVTVSGKPEDLMNADRLLLPGVGAFADCLQNLQKAELDEPILEHIRKGKPFLGICVGMQLLFSRSFEFGEHNGLDLLAGDVLAFKKDMTDPLDQSRHLKVPHMGWSPVQQQQEHPMWDGIPDATHFYFVHSFYAKPNDEKLTVGAADYGMRFCAAVSHENLFATQFHPEKSQAHGLKLLENFVTWRA
ncbi:MAG: imidazole glycerol phosphate synthase subunit HisH [Magnetococcales bacterium]|nr:imidazole glycerol phosphate synthase subunit HisH [Magnetococcales bacterium]